MKHSEENNSPTRGGIPLSEWLCTRLDIPADVLAGGIRLDLRGRHTLTVHGCRRIVDFSPTCIRLSLVGCDLVVEGDRLTCTSYLAGAVGIEGCICRVAFDDEQRADAPDCPPERRR